MRLPDTYQEPCVIFVFVCVSVRLRKQVRVIITRLIRHCKRLNPSHLSSSAYVNSLPMLRQLCVVLALAVASGFNVMPAARPANSLRRSAARAPQPQAVVIEISSQEEFDKALDGAGGSLVVIDYSTSWCGPCKIIAPKYDEFSEQYKNVAFLKARRPRETPRS